MAVSRHKKGTTKPRPSPYDPTTPRAELFCLRYVESFNGAQAAREAGFGARMARKSAWELLQLPEIQARIKALTATKIRKAELSVERTLEELAVLCFSNIDHYAVDAETGEVALAEGAPASAKRAIASVKYKSVTHPTRETVHSLELRFWDKNAAITNAMKYHGLLTEKVEHSADSSLEALLAKSWQGNNQGHQGSSQAHA